MVAVDGARFNEAVPKPLDTMSNKLLQRLSPTDRDALLGSTSLVDLPVGFMFARMGDSVSSVLFPESGVVSIVGEMKTGHHLAVGAVGVEGVVGLEALFGSDRHDHALRVLVEARGRFVPAHVFTDVFEESQHFRHVVLAYLGTRARELTSWAVCNRVHSHRQRLARWLLVATEKAGVASLPITHDALAQMVGGPRHAVTVALSELRRRGAIAHTRGRIDVLDRPSLTVQSCECYIGGGRTGLYRLKR